MCVLAELIPCARLGAYSWDVRATLFGVRTRQASLPRHTYMGCARSWTRASWRRTCSNARSRACAHLGALAWMLCALQGTRTPGHHMCPYWPMWGTRSKVCAPEHVPRRCVRSWACAHLGWACPPGWHAWDACARGSALLGMCASGINTPPLVHHFWVWAPRCAALVALFRACASDALLLPIVPIF